MVVTFHFLTTITFLGRDKDGGRQSARESTGQLNPDENEAMDERGTFFSLFNYNTRKSGHLLE